MGKTERESTAMRATTSPSLDLVFNLLSVRRRRYALYYLTEQTDGITTFDKLVDDILAREADSENREEHKQQIQTSLQHVHLPRLEDAGILEYDARSDTVRYWQQPTLEEWLEHARHKEFID
ncbi:hypothetical protein EL22_02645 [Halostagnicola sp. A56]|uniref:DUF7344 domain-containing protein n=1 Tax=Halostagnicola sp. A56 TaxID=1495067 RepID=UPI00049FA87D|nr:hypothetical protein [Halostagnicola sp. A56]KDE58764.1 hypothetical protein EL22_02645 [Halostagnicola sp. A56]